MRLSVRKALAKPCSAGPWTARYAPAPVAFHPAAAAGCARARWTRHRACNAQRRPLTLRESEILRLAAKGLGFETISDPLEISLHTVTAYVKKIYRKLSVHSRDEAVYEASQMGWL